MQNNTAVCKMIFHFSDGHSTGNSSHRKLFICYHSPCIYLCRYRYIFASVISYTVYRLYRYITSVIFREIPVLPSKARLVHRTKWFPFAIFVCLTILRSAQALFSQSFRFSRNLPTPRKENNWLNQILLFGDMDKEIFQLTEPNLFAAPADNLFRQLRWFVSNQFLSNVNQTFVWSTEEFVCPHIQTRI